jgi:hypothetical protein
MSMIRYLAESENYKVTSEYEYATLHFKSKPLKESIDIGDFYGDPNCAIISRDERYVVVGGCGLIIYRLEEPFAEYGDDKNTNQYFEFFREPPNDWWINGLHQTNIDSDRKYFRFIAANNDGEFIYRMDAESFKVEKINSSLDNTLTTSDMTNKDT